jgi:hypothetical protein
MKYESRFQEGAGGTFLALHANGIKMKRKRGDVAVI